MDKKLTDILSELNLLDREAYEDNAYTTIELNNYDEFTDVYNALERSLDFDKNSEASWLTESEAHVEYELNPNCSVELVALLDDDDYTVNISKDN